MNVCCYAAQIIAEHVLTHSPGQGVVRVFNYRDDRGCKCLHRLGTGGGAEHFIGGAHQQPATVYRRRRVPAELVDFQTRRRRAASFAPHKGIQPLCAPQTIRNCKQGSIDITIIIHFATNPI